MNLFQRIIGIITSPVKVMESLAEKPTILFPILLILFSPSLFIFSRYPIFHQTMKEILLLSTQQPNNQLTAEQMQMAINITIVSLTVILPIILLVVWIIASGVIYGIFKFFNGEGRFKQYLSITGYSLIVITLSLLLMIILSFFNGKLFVDFSPAIFIQNVGGNQGMAFLRGLLSGFNIFYLWSYAVLGIGINVISKLGKKKVNIIMISLYLSFTLLNAFLSGSSAPLI